jgi:hypothetical protein
MQKIDFTKLLGFQTVASSDDETVTDKLGARVGQVEPNSPVNGIDFTEENLGGKLGAKVGFDEAEPSPTL